MKNKCQVCAEALTKRLPYCDTTPLAISLPKDIRFCFWCRRDLLQYIGDIDKIDDNNITVWVARWLRLAVVHRVNDQSIHRCEIGNGRDRCARFAKIQRDGLWVCGRHAQPRFCHAPRHYLDWRSQRTHHVEQTLKVLVIPPRPKQPKQFVRENQKGSNNYNAFLTENDVVTIRQLIAKGEFNTTIARKFGVTHSQISLIRRGKTWKHI